MSITRGTWIHHIHTYIHTTTGAGHLTTTGRKIAWYRCAEPVAMVPRGTIYMLHMWSKLAPLTGSHRPVPAFADDHDSASWCCFYISVAVGRRFTSAAVNMAVAGFQR